MRCTLFLPLLVLAGLGCADPTTPSGEPAPGTYLLEVEGPFVDRPFLLAGDSVHRARERGMGNGILAVGYGRREG